MEKLLLFLVLGLIICASLSLISYLLMLLWNFLFPSLFGLSSITFLQALGFVILLSLVGGFFRSE